MFKLLSEILSHLYSVYIGLDVKVMTASRHIYSRLTCVLRYLNESLTFDI